jgi:hypothetical protein
MLTVLQDYKVRLASLGDGERSSGGCDTCILMHLYEWNHCSAFRSSRRRYKKRCGQQSYYDGGKD